MKIRKVKWKNHPILGDLELDFVNTLTNSPFDTVLFAGENGTGKTTILESLSTFLNRGTFEFFEFIEYLVNGKIYKAVPSTHTIKSFYQMIDDNGVATPMNTDRGNNPQLIDSNNLDIRHYGCIFSKARADYKTSKITTTTTKTFDVDRYDIDQEDDFTSLKQLIVDVQNQDNSEYANINKSRGALPMPWDDFYPTSKVYRFKNAFDNFFEKIKYDKVVDDNLEKSILFNKNAKSISIDKLSTGEKQIVFRGIYLLKNNKNLNGAAIMIDEPELSMHPKWQKNILKYYKELFNEAGSQKAQLFIATHSEHVLSDALSNISKNIVIVLNETNGVITAKRIDTPTILPSITSAETNYIAFDIVSNDYHIELYGWLQNKESNNSVKLCDEFIKNHARFNSTIHTKLSSFNTVSYSTLSTYIRNAIDHPDPSKVFTEHELRISIELLVELCR
jgi:predicted ATP-binding protein involved in virulence